MTIRTRRTQGSKNPWMRGHPRNSGCPAIELGLIAVLIIFAIIYIGISVAVEIGQILSQQPPL